MEIANDGRVEAELRRSGLVKWNSQGGGGSGEALELVVAPVLWIATWFVHLLVFRGGWTLWIHQVDSETGPISKARYRRKAAALADLDRQLQLARQTLESPDPRSVRG